LAQNHSFYSFKVEKSLSDLKSDRQKNNPVDNLKDINWVADI
jgi:hypothetical protein